MVRNRPNKIVYSSETTDNTKLGFTHYSYGFASRKFLDAFRVLDCEPVRIELPAYYGGRSVPEFDFHIIFRSTENIQTITECYNICCFAWEFEVLKIETRPFEHPFANQKRMLETCQEIWVPCNYTKELLTNFGLRNVFRIPAPITLPERRGIDKNALFLSMWRITSLIFKVSNTTPPVPNEIQSLTSRYCVIEAIHANRLFLTMFNPHDKRKNMQEMVFGFMNILQQYPDAVLIIKFVLAEEMTPLARVLNEVVRHYMEGEVTTACDRIVVLSGYLSDAQISALYEISNFYLCTSVAEGQNFPLLEAMSYGVIPVSTIHTAMADYLTAENCIPIVSRPVAHYRREMAADITGRSYSVEFASQTDIGRALLRACALPAVQHRQMQEQAQDTVDRHFSPQAVAKLIGERLEWPS